MDGTIDKRQESISGESVNVVISPSILAQNTFLYGQEIGYLEMNTSDTFAFNGKDCFLLLFVTDGIGTLINKNDKHILEKDNLLLIDCKKKHIYYSTEELHILYLYFKGNQAKAYYDMILTYNLTHQKIINSKTIRSLFWQIIALHRKKNILAEHLTSLHITRILTEISMLIDNQPMSDVEYPEYINDIFHRIGHFYKEKFTLDLLAEQYSVSKFHIAREFKRYAGTTLNAYLVTTRINKGKLLLRHTDKSVEQIADIVGFYNSSHFIKMFQKQEHVTPLYYRNQWTSSQ